MKSELQPGINHIELWVSNLSTSFQFYKGFLHLINWFPISSNAIVTANMEIYFKEMPGISTTPTLGIRHICFQAMEKEQVDKVSEYLKKTNTTIIRGPLTMPYSKEYYTVDFYDPDGCIVEVAFAPNFNN